MRWLIALLLASLSAVAQQVYPEVGVNLGCGASYFPVSVSGGMEVPSKRVLVLMKGNFNPGGKTDVGGHAWTSSNAALWRFRSGLLAGGSASVSQTVTPAWSKGPFIYPQPMAGFEHGRWRLIGHYTFPGSDSANGVHGPGGTLRGYYNSRVAIDLSLAYYWAHASYSPVVDQSSVRYSVGISYLFRGVREPR